MTMTKGEQAFFMTCPSYSYGKNGTRQEPLGGRDSGDGWPEITGQEWLLWKIEVINVIPENEHSTDIFKMEPHTRTLLPFSEVLAAAATQQKLGKEAFSVSRFSSAKKYFEKAAKLLLEERIVTENEAAEKRSRISQVKLPLFYSKFILFKYFLPNFKLFCNIAICIHKMELDEPENSRNYEDIYENSISSTEFDNKNAKAWYFAGFSLRKLGRLAQAEKCLKTAQSLCPSDVKIGRELVELDKDFRSEKIQQRDILKKMVGANENNQSIRKVPAALENVVSEQFRKRVSSQIEQVMNGSEDFVTFEPWVLTKDEVAYVKAFVTCLPDKANIELSTFNSELGHPIILVQRLSK